MKRMLAAILTTALITGFLCGCAGKTGKYTSSLAAKSADSGTSRGKSSSNIESAEAVSGVSQESSVSKEPSSMNTSSKTSNFSSVGADSSSASADPFLTLRTEIESQLSSYLNINPKITYHPGYDPKYAPGTKNDQWSNIRALTFDGAALGGQKTKVFAYIGYPSGASSTNKSPAVVLLHGGGGHAFAEWVKKWTDKGFTAIAFDNTGYFPSSAGKGIAGREGDPQSYWNHGLYGDFSEGGYVNAPGNSGMSDAGNASDSQWMFQAVAQTILAHNILRNDPNVDSSKIGISGISWGGVITSIAIGLDTRWTFAIPIYGSGYLDEALSYFGSLFGSEVCKAVWSAQKRFNKIKFSVLWLGWNSDTAFSINSNSASYLDTKNISKTAFAMLDGMGHSHASAWKQEISYRYADWVVKNRAGIVRLINEPEGHSFSFRISKPSDATGASAKIYYLTEKLTYTVENMASKMDQTWKTAECAVSGDKTIGQVTGAVPADASSYYVEITANTPEGDFISTSSFVKLK